MNLKEAFRFQNKLGTLMEEAERILNNEANITKVESTYLRRKVFDGAKNGQCEPFSVNSNQV